MGYFTSSDFAAFYFISVFLERKTQYNLDANSSQTDL